METVENIVDSQINYTNISDLPGHGKQRNLFFL